MRTPQKTNLVYKTLKNNILSGKLLPGMQLPPETELAKNMNVGRVTLRSALKKLEAESLVKRIERKGTFVRLQQSMPSLTLLLPCENYVEKSGYGSIMSTQMILNGMISTAQQHGYQVRTLAVSKSNSINERRLKPYGKGESQVYQKMSSGKDEYNDRSTVLYSTYFRRSS